MGILSESFVVDALVAIIMLFGILYYYMTANFDYWKKRGVPYLKPTFFFGNLKDQFLLKKPLFLAHDDMYKKLAGERFAGYFEFRTPVLLIRDADLIERILIKDFSYFSDRDFGINLKKEPVSANLFSLKGRLWKTLRNKLTPTFTTGKLKGMFEQICNCGDDLLRAIEKNSGEAINAKNTGSIFSIDVIASVTFGLQFSPESEEGIQFRKMTDAIFAPSPIRMLKMSVIIFFKPLAQLLRLRQFPQNVTEYMVNLVKTTMQFRESNNIQRNDFLQLMMNLKTLEASGKEINWKTELSEEDAYLNQMDYSTKDEDENESGGLRVKIITDECIAAQSIVFLTGGSEAVANAVGFALYELASNPDVQQKLQQEVDSVMQKYGGNLTYEGLMKETPYLDMVVQERNRKYSEGGFLMRICTAPYTIPGTKVVIEKGMRVVVPMYAIHHDPGHYPEPERFIPERFEGNNHRTSSTYLPFGEGPRVCIAMRFVILELKACIAKIMTQYSVTLDSKTKVPLQYDPTSMNLSPIGGIWINMTHGLILYFHTEQGAGKEKDRIH